MREGKRKSLIEPCPDCGLGFCKDDIALQAQDRKEAAAQQGIKPKALEYGRKVKGK